MATHTTPVQIEVRVHTDAASVLRWWSDPRRHREVRSAVAATDVSHMRWAEGSDDDGSFIDGQWRERRGGHVQMRARTAILPKDFPLGDKRPEPLSVTLRRDRTRRDGREEHMELDVTGECVDVGPNETLARIVGSLRVTGGPWWKRFVPSKDMDGTWAYVQKMASLCERDLERSDPDHVLHQAGSSGQDGATLVRVGDVEFQLPLGRVLNKRKWFGAVYFLALSGWALAGSWDSHRLLGVVAALVFLELALAAFRVAQHVGTVAFRQGTADRVASLLEELCRSADFPPPRVVLRDDAVRSACVQRRRGRTSLLLSEPFIDRVDDQELRAIMAHEMIHIAHDDFESVKGRAWASIIVAGVGAGVAASLIGGTTDLPLYAAFGLLAAMAAQVSLSVLNRRLERRADIEGAELCGDPRAMASALGVAHIFSAEARRRIYGPRPWRWILSPLSWTMPTHPPMSQRIAHLMELAHTEHS